MAQWGEGRWDLSYWSATVGYMAAVETGTDTFSAEGVNVLNGYMAATETGTDSFSASGAVIDTGYMAAVETEVDTFSATGVNVNNGDMAATETGVDVFSATGVNVLSGYLAATETEVDTFSAEGVVIVTGYMAAVETEVDTFAATGEVIPVPTPQPVITADIGPGDEKHRRKVQKKRDEAFEREKQKADELRQQIKRAINPVVEKAEPVVVSEGTKSIQVLSLDGSRLGIAVPPAFDAAQVAQMVAEVLEAARIEAQHVQRRQDAQRALDAARAAMARIIKRKRDDEVLLLLD